MILNQKILAAILVVSVIVVIVAVGLVLYKSSKPIDLEKIKSAIRLEKDGQKQLIMVTDEINKLLAEKSSANSKRGAELDVVIAELTRVRSVIMQTMPGVVPPPISPPVVVSPPVSPPVVVSPPVSPPVVSPPISPPVVSPPISPPLPVSPPVVVSPPVLPPSPINRAAEISALEATVTDFFRQTGRIMDATALHKTSSDPTIKAAAQSALAFAQSADTEVRRNARVFVIAAFDANQASNFPLVDLELTKAKSSLEQGSSLLRNAQQELRNMNISVLKVDLPALQRANNQIYYETAPYVSAVSMITKSLVTQARADADASGLEIMRANAFLDTAQSYMTSGNTKAADENIESAKAKYQSAMALTRRAQGQIPSIKM
jgi:hypothetical protein